MHASGIDEGENLAWGYDPTFRTCVQAMEGWLIYLIFVCYRYRFFFFLLFYEICLKGAHFNIFNSSNNNKMVFLI